MDKIYKTGDVVRLKSGGELMTVKEYKMLLDIETVAYSEDKDYEYVVCQWFEGRKLMIDEFHVNMIQKA